MSVTIARARNLERGPSMARSRGVAIGAPVSLSALTALLLALVAIDDRVREQIVLRVSAGPTAQLADLGSRVRDVAGILAVAARNQSIEHAPLMIFVVAATV